MATYDKAIYNIPPYQEGNKADFEFDVEENFPIAEVNEISFQVRDSSGRQLIPEKLLSTGGITKNGYTITIPFSAQEMTGIVGKHQYEIDFINANNEPFATIGGAFIVNRQVNRR